jgi:2-dehydropantoate 2-reductase
LADIMKCVDSCSITSNLWGVRWSKLCVNGMRNALSAVTGMSGNERDSHDVVRRISMQLGSEAARVGQALGYQLESMVGIPAARFALVPDDPSATSEIEEALLRGTRSSARSNDQRPSMAQDIQKGRRTEIDFLNGLIIARGKEVKTPTPTHERIVEVARRVERGQLQPRPENVLAWS